MSRPPGVPPMPNKPPLWRPRRMGRPVAPRPSSIGCATPSTATRLVATRLAAPRLAAPRRDPRSTDSDSVGGHSPGVHSFGRDSLGGDSVSVGSVGFCSGQEHSWHRAPTCSAMSLKGTRGDVVRSNTDIIKRSLLVCMKATRRGDFFLRLALHANCTTPRCNSLSGWHESFESLERTPRREPFAARPRRFSARKIPNKRSKNRSFFQLLASSPPENDESNVRLDCRVTLGSAHLQVTPRRTHLRFLLP